MKNSKPPPRKINTNQKESNNTSKEQICDICAQNVPGPEREKIFAFGKCDHYVCYVCSARLRVICQQSDCPICRNKLDTVVFSSNKTIPFDKFEKFNLKNSLYDDKYKIYFENKAIKEAFDKLLKYECQECLKTPTKGSNPDDINDVVGLITHLHRVHKLKLCDLCLTHNKLFPFEFSYYDHASLKKHMKEGAPKTSHRGHPDCVLCHHTFFNTDELIQHMSREHYHCHLCGRQDSNMRIYFLDYENLREHFKSKHFLCERDNCTHEQFTSAFDNRIDYQLHLVQVHGNPSSSMSRGEARQQRTITLESAPHRARDLSPTRSMRQNLPPNAALVSTGTMATANNARQQRQPESTQLVRQQRLPTRAEFPALGHTSTSSTFPHETTGDVSTFSHRLVAGPSNSRGSFVRSAGGIGRAPERLNEMDFPPLPAQPPNRSKSKLMLKRHGLGRAGR